MQKLIQLAKKIFAKYESIIVYVFFGGLTTIVAFGVYFLVRFFGLGVIPSNVISWICAVLFAFFTNRIWVFKSPTKTTAEFLKQISSFFGARLFSLLVETTIMWFFIDIHHYNELIVKLAASVVVLILNYILSKLIVFRKKEQVSK